ncbi:GNAT family N-acetyltransferase [Legionella sp. W05-934-2]|jgi:ribosomal protein S18 acetylase RimI-like enzyme|uniref:GNAT family N-acetyltransferase n=1 Tax=Legionella sp. W05-934-2 TaxID=1198649 RepID=UPI0034631006
MTVQLMIRKAQITDLSDLVLIENTCFPTDKINKRQMRYMITKAKCLLYVAYDKNTQTVLGYGLCFTPLNRKTARLYSLAVLPDYQGAHVASNLLVELFKKLKEQGYEYCTLEVRSGHPNTQSLYHKFGFVDVKTIDNYYADGESALRMRLVL